MARILIVDDEPMNRELLHAYLDGAGHTLVDAESGERALTLVTETHPDLVLLDVMMPGMNGFETTRRLKDRVRDEYLPIILITALHDSTSLVLGLKMGADEFLTKPVDRQELNVRVHNLLALREKDQALLKKNVEHAELHRFKDQMSAMIVHDLKNPMSAILANLDYALQKHGGVDEDTREALQDAQTAGKRVLGLLANLLEVARIEGGHLDLRRAPTRLDELVSEALVPRMLNARLRDITLRPMVSTDIAVDVDRDLFTRVFENIFDNGLRYAGSGGRIEVLTALLEDRVQVRIGNTGKAIPPDERKLVFEKFGQGSSSVGRMNLGLGLYFCRLAVEAHGGRIWVEESADLPTVFALELPYNRSAGSENARTTAHA